MLESIVNSDHPTTKLEAININENNKYLYKLYKRPLGNAARELLWFDDRWLRMVSQCSIIESYFIVIKSISYA